MIIGDYQIEADSNQVILSEHSIISGNTRGPRKARPENIGKDKWSPIGYYGNLPNALWGLSNHELNKSGMATLEQVLAKIDELIATISKVTNVPIDLMPVNRGVAPKPIDHTAPLIELPKTITKDDPKPKRVLTPEHIAKMQAGRVRRK